MHRRKKDSVNGKKNVTKAINKVQTVKNTNLAVDVRILCLNVIAEKIVPKSQLMPPKMSPFNAYVWKDECYSYRLWREM